MDTLSDRWPGGRILAGEKCSEKSLLTLRIELRACLLDSRILVLLSYAGLLFITVELLLDYAFDTFFLFKRVLARPARISSQRNKNFWLKQRATSFFRIPACFGAIAPR